MLRLSLALLAAAALLVAAGPSGSATEPHHVGHHGEGYDPPPAPPAPPPPPPPAGKNVLVATVGPANTIALRTKAGKRVKKLKAGRYTIQVNDRSNEHNFRLVGPGVKKKTGVAFVGTTTWRVRLRKGKVYRFRCDPHLFSMKGSFKT